MGKEKDRKCEGGKQVVVDRRDEVRNTHFAFINKRNREIEKEKRENRK